MFHKFWPFLLSFLWPKKVKRRPQAALFVINIYKNKLIILGLVHLFDLLLRKTTKERKKRKKEEKKEKKEKERKKERKEKERKNERKEREEERKRKRERKTQTNKETNEIPE